MSRVRYAIDSPFSESWATRIGKLILNFASLELESYLWLVQMSEQPELIPKFIKQRFKPRANKIVKYAGDRSFSDQWKVDALRGWRDAIELAELRNRIAHNPLVFAWADDVKKGEPDFIGAPDMHARDRQGEVKDPLMSKADIDAAMNRIADLVSHLASLRSEWCALRDEAMDS